MKKCPFCAEDIQDEAKVCKHCGRDLGRGASQVQIVAPKKKTSAVTWFVTILFGIIFLGWCSSMMRPTPSPSVSQPATPDSSRPATPGRNPAVPPPGGKWTELEQASQMDDSEGVSFLLEAENTVEGWLTRKKPSLIVRCREKKTDVYMVIGMAASVEHGDLEGHTVRVRFDDSPAQRQRWTESTDNEALFAPGAVQMARYISRSKMLRVEFTPFNASPAVVTFDVSGFNQHIGKVAAACGWDS